MKPLAIWLGAVGAVFVLLALVTSLLPKDTSRVFVVVDSSFAMRSVWDDIESELDDIGGRDDAEFALATEKAFIHSWQDDLRLGAIEPFAPCTFEGIEGHTEVGEADDLILITTAGSCATTALTGWEIRLLDSTAG